MCYFNFFDKLGLTCTKCSDIKENKPLEST